MNSDSPASGRMYLHSVDVGRLDIMEFSEDSQRANLDFVFMLFVFPVMSLVLLSTRFGALLLAWNQPLAWFQPGMGWLPGLQTHSGDVFGLCHWCWW